MDLLLGLCLIGRSSDETYHCDKGCDEDHDVGREKDGTNCQAGGTVIRERESDLAIGGWETLLSNDVWEAL